MTFLKNILFLCAFLATAQSNFAQIRLPEIIRDSMIIQRNKPIKIWGWASNGDKISVTFNGIYLNTVASNKGDWDVEFPKMKAGGP